MAGDNRITLISRGILYPFAIAVDASRSRIFWVDAYRDTIESSDLNGLQRRVIMRNSHTLYYDLAIYKVWGQLSAKYLTRVSETFFDYIRNRIVLFA